MCATRARVVAGATGTTISSSTPRQRSAFIEGRGDGSASVIRSPVAGQSGQIAPASPPARAPVSAYAGISTPWRLAQATFALIGWHRQVVQHARAEEHPHSPPAHG